MKLFDQDGKLDVDVQDVLYELSNVGVGMASVTLGKLLGVRVELQSPNVVPIDEVSDQTLSAMIGQDEVGIWMRFVEPLNGWVLFLLKRLFLYDVVEKMTGIRCEGKQLYEQEVTFSAVTEFANMLSAAYMKAVGKYTGMRIFMSPYLFVFDKEQIGSVNAFASQGAVADKAIWVETKFQLLDEGEDQKGEQTHDVGRVIMLPDDHTVKMLMEALGI